MFSYSRERCLSIVWLLHLGGQRSSIIRRWSYMQGTRHLGRRQRHLKSRSVISLLTSTLAVGHKYCGLHRLEASNVDLTLFSKVPCKLHCLLLDLDDAPFIVWTLATPPSISFVQLLWTFIASGLTCRNFQHLFASKAQFTGIYWKRVETSPIQSE